MLPIMRTPAPEVVETPAAADPLRGGLASPLNIAAFVTWLAVCVSVLQPAALAQGEARAWSALLAFVGFMALYVLRIRSGGTGGDGGLWMALGQGALVVAADASLRTGSAAVLLIIVAAQLVLMMPLRAFLPVMFAFNAGLAAIWTTRGAEPGQVLISLLQIGGFQAFAALTGHYAGTREQAREHLARVNAELLATRRLLEESARAGERLKLSRELHDVAGHSLTALKLNLARLARDAALREREEIAVSVRLADDLLAQIRQVVGALRAHDGLDLRAALEALSAPMPGVRVALDVEAGLRVDDLDQAEALLRCAQEAITNALRHGRAGTIRIALRREAGALTLRVDNDGLAPAQLREGHGLTGMRERLAAVGGTLELESTPPRGLRLTARIPEPAAVRARADGSAHERADARTGTGTDSLTDSDTDTGTDAVAHARADA